MTDFINWVELEWGPVWLSALLFCLVILYFMCALGFVALAVATGGVSLLPVPGFVAYAYFKYKKGVKE